MTDAAPTDAAPIVVVGAGYAGAHAAHAAGELGATVLVVDTDGRHEFAPRLAAVAAGAADAGDAWAGAQELLEVQVLSGQVESVDTARRLVRLDHGRELAYGALVVTVGAMTALPPVPGLGDHPMTLKTAGDALRVRTALDSAERLIVVGAGASGVQLAGEVAARHDDVVVDLIERENHVLPELRRSVGHRAAHLLRKRGVRVHLGTEVERVTDAGVRLDSGRTLEGLVVWTTGFEARGNTVLPDPPTHRGRLMVDRYLRVPGTELVFAAGDVARHRDVFGRPLGMSAQVALQAGKVAGRNAVRAVSGERLERARLMDLGRVVSLGQGAGVGQVASLPLALPVIDRMVPMLHAAVDARHLFQLGGVGALLGHAPGRHDPSAAELRRAERPALRTVS